jgi:endonuclease/exonuclease/phosphatase family metal-dependent hydrolase
VTGLTIVSLNAWGGAVWPALGDWVADIAPDVLCLQEMIRAPVPGPDRLVYADPHRRLDQRADLFSDISARLPAHQAIFAPAARGPLFDADGRVLASEHGLGLWVARRLAIADYASSFVHGRYRPDGWGPEPVPRTMQMARIVDPATGGALVVAHLHGLRDPSGKGDTPERAAQAEAVARALAGFQRGADEPMVLAGDLNLLPDSAFFGRMAGLGLSDLVTARGIADTRTHLYAKPQRHADYMLVRDTGPVDRFEVPGMPVVSDHRPLVLRTRLAAGP